MLKRYQVLLPDWLEHYIKHVVDIYDLSFSEIIRLQICISTLFSIKKLYPDFESSIEFDEIFKADIENPAGNLERDKMFKLISKIYFETRKAIDYRFAQEKKTK